MDDRELLELAAKAAGVKVQYSDNCGDFSIGEPYSKSEARWNPLKFDGDALRLATHLGLSLMFGQRGCYAWVERYNKSYHETSEFFGVHQDAIQAARRAIVRAAAEIGKSL